MSGSEGVTTTVGGLLAYLQQLTAEHPEAVDFPVITWTDCGDETRGSWGWIREIAVRMLTTKSPIVVVACRDEQRAPKA